MKVGVDCQALQTPASRQRGIGIYTCSLLQALTRSGDHEYHLFFSNAFPAGDAPPGERHDVRYERPLNAPETEDANAYLQRLAYMSRDLDLLYIPSPVDGPDAVVDVMPDRRPYAVVCTLHDLIPLRYPEVYLKERERERIYRRQLQVYQHADLIISVSESSRQDAIRLLKLSPDRLVTVLSAVDPVFTRTSPDERQQRLRRVTGSLQLRLPFILSTSGYDFRKNIKGLFQAFSLLPERLRRDHQLVVVCDLDQDQATTLRASAARFGIVDSLVLTGYVPQDTLVTLLNCCTLFVFPSLYEGFGFPVLEAMACGAPVIASNTSSIPEVLGDAGILVDPQDAAAIAHAIQRVLESAELRRQLSEQGLRRATAFAWKRTADGVLNAFTQACANRRVSLAQARGRKPKIAYFSPLPPLHSGISAYSEELLPRLAAHFDIDVFLDGYAPQGLVGSDMDGVRFLTASAPLSAGYYGTLFQMGNSPYHAYMWDLIDEHPGITVLHETFLHDLVYWMLTQAGHNRQAYVDELIYQHGEQARIALSMLGRGRLSDAELIDLFPLNQQVLSASKGVIVHSEYAQRELLQGRSRQLAGRVGRIALGMVLPTRPTDIERAGLARRLGIPSSGLVIGTFGLLSPAKQLERCLEVVSRVPEAWYLVVGDFVSPEYGASLRTLCARLGIADRVVFTGYAGADDFHNYLFLCDIVLSLRYPSHGETSASLLHALACGVATIVNDFGTAAELPRDAVFKTPAVPDDLALLDAVRYLAEDRPMRARLGTAARTYISEYHSWEVVARAYANFIHEIEDTGAGDQHGLRKIIEGLMGSARRNGLGRRRLYRFVDACVSSEGIGKVLWV